MRKKKIFLGAYINHLNAQNINCKSIAIHLDKDKYEVKTLLLGKNNIPDISGVKYIIISRFLYKTSNLLAFIRGTLWADVLYMPKHQSTPKFILKIASLLSKKIFTTIEGNMCNMNVKSMIDSFGSKKNMINYFKYIPNIYAITQHLVDTSNCGVKLNPNPLKLGVEQHFFKNECTKESLNNIVFVGSLIKRKKIDEILKVASLFTELNFHIVGDGELRKTLESRSSDNVIFHGQQPHDKMLDLFAKMDLHILLSRSEGYPKVILETASSSIPSLVYNDYGASSWINSNENGFVVDTIDQVMNKINELINNPELLKKNSEGAYLFSVNYDWKKIIKDWECEIDNLR